MFTELAHLLGLVQAAGLPNDVLCVCCIGIQNAKLPRGAACLASSPEACMKKTKAMPQRLDLKLKKATRRHRVTPR